MLLHRRLTQLLYYFFTSHAFLFIESGFRPVFFQTTLSLRIDALDTIVRGMCVYDHCLYDSPDTRLLAKIRLIWASSEFIRTLKLDNLWPGIPFQNYAI
jgi:hypothetical protein